MRFIQQISITTLLLTGLASCFDPPEYPVTPSITYENVVFKDSEDPTISDTLVVSINFKDGDGNLGIDGTLNVLSLIHI
jgi:hypothetical protein